MAASCLGQPRLLRTSWKLLALSADVHRPGGAFPLHQESLSPFSSLTKENTGSLSSSRVWSGEGAVQAPGCWACERPSPGASTKAQHCLWDSGVGTSRPCGGGLGPMPRPDSLPPCVPQESSDSTHTTIEDEDTKGT